MFIGFASPPHMVQVPNLKWPIEWASTNEFNKASIKLADTKAILSARGKKEEERNWPFSTKKYIKMCLGRFFLELLLQYHIC